MGWLTRKPGRGVVACTLALLMSGCSLTGVDEVPEWDDMDGPELTAPSETFGDLIELPEPAGEIPAAVYGFRDQTGQFREAPQSNFSTAVTQGGASLLTSALLDSGWFQPLEREGLQDLLTERRIARQLREDIPGLRDARVMFEGGIVGYESNVTTGGAGARYFGLGASEEYRIDQVTVNLRAVDINTGEILVSVDTTKTIYSEKLDGDLFRFVRQQRLLEAEGGYSRNEPRYLAVRDALSAALIHLIVEGVDQNHWRLADSDATDAPVMEAYRDRRQQRMESAEGLRNDGS